MSDHGRKQVRDAVVTALQGLNITGARVYSGRYRQVDEDDMPCLIVSTRREVVRDDLSSMGTSIGRDVDVMVEIHATRTLEADVDDRLDAIAAEVEAALGADRTLGGKVIDIEIRETAFTSTPELEIPPGLGVLTFSALYRTAQTDPTILV